MNYKKISVLIVTYKQQDVIGRNIESILKQKEYGLNEIVICDDCSPDDNWRVISEYVKKYPGIVRAYRNETNLGIYGNSNKLMSLRGESDLFCWLEGDDALCDGFFKAAQEYISINKVETSRAVGIFSGYKTITPEGKEIIYKNDYFSKHIKQKPFGAYTRGYVSWRSGLFSESVMKQFEPVIINQGLSLAEFLFDGQWFRNVEIPLYLPYISSVYYAGIGVSTFLDETEYRKSEASVQWDYYLKNMAADYYDIKWGRGKFLCSRYNKESLQNVLKQSWYIVSVLICLFIGMLPYGVNWKRIKTNIYVMLKK